MMVPIYSVIFESTESFHDVLLRENSLRVKEEKKTIDTVTMEFVPFSVNRFIHYQS